MNVSQAYYQTPLGLAEIVANEDAVLSISILDKSEAKKIPKKALEAADSKVLKKCVQELDEYFQGKRKNFTFKLQRQGTNFQKQVWQALDEIPFGKTVTYGDIAKRIGRPKAGRAVGSTIGKNPHWVVAPCHRVIGKDGTLTGYAGGLWRKKWLLEKETGKKVSA